MRRGSFSRRERSFVKVKDLTPTSRGVNIIVKVLEVKSVRTVFSRRDHREHKVAEILVGDETGVVLLSLWDENIDKVQEGDVIEIGNGYVSLFRNEMRLNVGFYGSLKKSSKSIESINYSRDMSKKR